jgi:predicted MPP superfamily phosphohydrolase
MITRRGLLTFLFASLASLTASAAYAVGYGPLQTPRITRYRLTPRGWPNGHKLTMAVLSDIHVVDPWMGAERLQRIVAQTNALDADIILLLGDFVSGMRKYRLDSVPPAVWGPVLGQLQAPLGVHAVLGNHDWWEDHRVQTTREGMPFARDALNQAGIMVYHNEAVRLVHRGRGFWLAGLGDQIALPTGRPHRWQNLADLPGTLGQCTSEEPILMMAHEPDIFARMPDRVSLTLSGHTHGGQVNVFGWRPVVPSHFGQRYAYGHIREDNRDLIVSGGLGCSIAPIRVGVPPEILLIELGTA